MQTEKNKRESRVGSGVPRRFDDDDEKTTKKIKKSRSNRETKRRWTVVVVVVVVVDRFAFPIACDQTALAETQSEIQPVKDYELDNIFKLR